MTQTEKTTYTCQKIKDRFRAISTIALLAALLACSHWHGIQHLTRIEERPDVEILDDGSALMRSLYCDIIVAHLDDSKFLPLLNSYTYTRDVRRTVPQRIPKLIFFSVIIKNTVSSPISLENVQLKYNNIFIDRLNEKDVTAEFKSPSYESLDFNRLFSYQRLINKRKAVGKIDYDRDLIKSTFSFIPPYDSTLTIVAFKMVPVQVRKYRLFFTFNARGKKKIIDFHLSRHEYRTSGKDFINPAKKPGNKKRSKLDENR